MSHESSFGLLGQYDDDDSNELTKERHAPLISDEELKRQYPRLYQLSSGKILRDMKPQIHAHLENAIQTGRNLVQEITSSREFLDPDALERHKYDEESMKVATNNRFQTASRR